MGDSTVTIATITAGDLRAEFHMGILDTHTDGLDGRYHGSFIQPCGPYLDMGRNDAVRKWYANFPDTDYLLFVDSDIAFGPDHVRVILDDADAHYAQTGERAIYGGIYQGIYGGGRKVIAYQLRSDDDGVRRFYPYTPDAISHVPTGALIEVDGLGTGFMLIHRDILDHFERTFPSPQEWFYEGVIGKNDWAGEDLFFCYRAQSLGYKIYAHSGVQLVHYKTIGLAFDPTTVTKEQ